jgi:hypothetical protein
MAFEKLPQDYDAGLVQKAIEKVKQGLDAATKKISQALSDQTQELNEKIESVDKNLTRKIAATTGDDSGYTHKVPIPQDLKVYEFGTWGFCHIDPFMRWKYPGTIRGYEFYGSQNVTGPDDEEDFEIQKDNYSQGGINYGTDTNWLDTEDTVGDGTWILDRGLIGKTLLNVDTGDEGPITSYGLLRPKFSITATGVTWSEGDRWIIKDYPKNRLFSIGGLAIFYKRTGNIWVKCRSYGKGYSYSNFTVATQSEGLTSSEDIVAPEFVYPVHACFLFDGGTVTRSCEMDETTGYLPKCGTHGIITDWEEIIGGTRQTEHYSFFGLEGCNVEVVWDEITDEDAEGKIFYHVRRWVDEPTDTPDTSEELEEEGDVR